MLFRSTVLCIELGSRDVKLIIVAMLSLLTIQLVLMSNSPKRNLSHPSWLTPICLNSHLASLHHNTLAHHHQSTGDNLKRVNNAMEV